MAFLALFSYVILVHQDTIPSIFEIVLIIFVCTLCTEEIRQILHSDPPMLRNKFKKWASNKWNLLDGIAVVLFFFGLGLRLHPTTRSAGHVVYCFDVALWIMRLLDFFSVNEHMGAYVVMIGRMTVDLTYFLLIMVVFFMAYGVAQQAILFPQELPSWTIISRIFFRPYFQAHGELFLDAPDIIENTTTVFGTPRKDVYGDTVVSVMMAFYLLVVNILLLNLLIAIFNNTYENVHAHANQIWKFHRYTLVMEYEQRPVLIPPFIILNHVIYAMRGLYCRCLGKCLRSDKPRKDYDDKMKMFEELCVDDYLREKDTLLHASQEEKIRVIGDRMESVSCQLQDMYKESISQSKSVNTRLKKVEGDLTKILGDQNKPRSRLASLAEIEVPGKSSKKVNHKQSIPENIWLTKFCRTNDIPEEVMDVLAQNQILSKSFLAAITEQDLADMGFVVGHKILLRRVISRLRQEGEDPQEDKAAVIPKENDLLLGMILNEELSKLEAEFSTPIPTQDFQTTNAATNPAATNSPATPDGNTSSEVSPSKLYNSGVCANSLTSVPKTEQSSSTSRPSSGSCTTRL